MSENPDKAKLLVFFGMTAAGKSFLAAHWARENGVSHYNTDVVRKELAGIAAASGRNEGIGRGIYSSEFSARTYKELINRAAGDFGSPPAGIVVVDGSYIHEKDRNDLVTAFKDEIAIYFIYCHCEEDIVKERLDKRASDPGAVSDGRWEIYLMQKESFIPPRAVENAKLIYLDTGRPLEKLLADVDCFIS